MNVLAKIRREFRAVRELLRACAPDGGGFRYDSPSADHRTGQPCENAGHDGANRLASPGPDLVPFHAPEVANV